MALPPEFDEALSKALGDCKPRTEGEVIKIVEDVLLDLNIDHAHWDEAMEIKKDLAWARETRVRCDNMKTKSLGIVITAVVMGLITVIGLGLKEWLHHG